MASTKISTEHLAAGHRDASFRAISNVLSTDIALETYAQIIDGLPLSHAALDRYRHKMHPKHPVDSHHELCPGAFEKAIEAREAFNIDSLRFDSQLLQTYQSASIGTRQYLLRLLELTAVALHQIAVYLFQEAASIHDLHHPQGSGFTIHDATVWERPPDMWLREAPWPTLFTHPGFTTVEQYPDGVADMAAYWVEDRILGGVLLFDRSQSWDHEDEPNAFFSICAAQANSPHLSTLRRSATGTSGLHHCTPRKLGLEAMSITITLFARKYDAHRPE
ncbi:uncharacterized protein F4822DRAFT_224949 [Hypoxylon trugodes]|uniref:uncharacterized protein n=1 Tax=Hypoxylon trugodes TaxID=326681 RepID=UPI00219D97FB|nr:uncharacterized protein F4822DRAFT_224949 [Hypoxylon trugodes]KAI1390124.1 hypothetical protein F4822DRAFT_224949 [Hypoxylon trugodes]